MFENGVDTVTANGDNNDTEDTVSGEKLVAVLSKRKKSKKIIKGSEEDVLGREVLIKPHVTDIPASTRSLLRRTAGLTCLADWRVRPECGKRIR